MQNTLLVGLSRQVALERELGVVSNNIANINTNGFKADGSIFEEYLAPGTRSGDSGGQVSFVRDRPTWIDMSQGSVERTGNPLDIAVNGKGFLVVQTPKGERYTRNGALQINSKGELVTSEGYQVLGDGGPIVLQPNDHALTISEDGTVSVRNGSDARTDSLRGKLRVVSFQNLGQLRKDGFSTFTAPANVSPQTDTQSRLEQGSLEKSNVRAVIEMTRMLEVTRSYTQVANMLSQQNDQQTTAIDKLAAVPN